MSNRGGRRDTCHRHAFHVCCSCHVGACAEPFAGTGTDSKEKVVIAHACGTFDVRVTRSHPGTGPVLGRMTLDKQSHGDRERTSQGEMLTASTPHQGYGHLRSH